MGETLLFDALRRSLVHSAHIASAGVIVDAKDDISSAFYRRYGFVEIPESDRRAFLSMETIRQMFP
jgi:hypothetical protein